MDIFEIIGSFGPWQLRVFLVMFYFNTVGIWQNLSITFLAPNMDFWCIEPQGRNETASALDDSCLVVLGTSGNHSVSSSTLDEIVPCTKWEYDKSRFSETIVSEWDLVCDREWLVSLAKSIYMVGFLLSVICFGQISDWMGRFPTLVTCYVITVVSTFLSLLSSSYTMFVVLRFFQAFGRTGFTTVGVVLVMEMAGPQHWTGAGIAIQLGGSLGFILLAGVAWLFRHWFWLQMAMAIPILPIMLAYSIVPESPRWLLMHGKVKRLEKLLIKAIGINGREHKIDKSNIEILKSRAKEEANKKSKNLFDLFRTPQIRKRTFIMYYLWIVNAFVYYALSFNTNELAGDPYLNFFVSGALEFPSCALLFWSIRKFGRRPTLVCFMLVGGTASVAIIPVPSNLPWLQTTFGMVGKFCITGSFTLLYLCTSELYPTVVRNVALGSCSMWARVGSMVAPFVRELGKATHSSVPNIIYGLLAFTSGLLALLLPETKGQKMPDTLEEGEYFGQLNAKEINTQAASSTQDTNM